MIKQLAIIGASGHGKVVADIARANGIEDIVFYDDRWREIKAHYGFAVIGSVQEAFNAYLIDKVTVVALGNNQTRAKLQQQLKLISPPLIHPSAIISPSAKIGAGTVIMPHAVINADAVIGDGCIVNTGAIVEHDCEVGDFVHISPNAALAGGVKVGSHSWLGIGSSVIQLVRVGQYVNVGAGAIVIRNIADQETVVGNPAKSLKR